MKEVLDLEIRKKIYTLILKNPGLHAKKIAEILSIHGQLADYHLLYLERNELVTTTKEGGYRRYYIKGKIGRKERRQIAILRQKIPLKIVIFLLKNPKSRHKEILKKFDIAKSTLTYHLKKLVIHEIISEHSDGKDKIYRVENENEIIRLLIRYKPYSRIEGFEETWMDLRWPGTSK